MPSKQEYLKKSWLVVWPAYAILLIISCTKQKDMSLPQNSHPMVADTSHLQTTGRTYLALGDSYTIGEAVLPGERFASKVTAMLRIQGISINNPEIIAVTGWTTANLINSLNNAPPGHQYSFVSLLIGVNNQYQGRSLEEYKSQFADLLGRAIYYAAGISDHVFVLSIPDYSVTPFAQGRDTERISNEIDTFNQANKAISLQAGVHYVDITSISREARNIPALTASDGLHPSAMQYDQWAKLLAPLLFNTIH